MGEKPTNQRIHWTEIHIYRLHDGKIREHWVEMATMELLQQIGALPQPAKAAWQTTDCREYRAEYFGKSHMQEMRDAHLSDWRV